MGDTERTIREQEAQKAKVTIVLFKWNGWSNFYQVQHVNAISRMFTHYLKIPYRIVLLTDDMEGDATAEVDEVLPVPPDPKGLKLLTHVNCFKRLNLFDPDYASQFGTEFVISIDLDTLIRGDITHLISSAMDHPYGLCIVRGRWAGRQHVDLTKELKGKRKLPVRPYNGAFFMVRVGDNAQVWNDFHPVNTPIEIRKLRWVGSDQCAISLLAPNALTLGPEHGMYFFGQYLKERRANPKAQALVLNFAGRNKKPWSKPVKFEAKDIWQEYMRWLDEEPATGRRRA